MEQLKECYNSDCINEILDLTSCDQKGNVTCDCLNLSKIAVSSTFSWEYQKRLCHKDISSSSFKSDHPIKWELCL